MPYDPHKHHRRSIRLRDYDYASEGLYFVTLCVVGRACTLGEVRNGSVHLSTYGQGVADAWNWLGKHFPNVVLDAWIIMPNHLHGIIALQDTNTPLMPTGEVTRRKSLSQLIGAFKTTSAKHINLLRGTPGMPCWQRNYWEHVVRDEADLNRIRAYINSNPIRWAEDHLYLKTASDK